MAHHIIGLAYIQPLTLFDTFGLVSERSGGHVPTSYIFALVAILLTSISYGHMIKRYPSSGSAYTYAQKSIHPNVGFMVGWSSWLDYLLSPRQYHFGRYLFKSIVSGSK